MIEQQVRDVPELRTHRSALSRLLREQADTAWQAGTSFYASMVEPTEDGPITASVAVLVVPAPTVTLGGGVQALPARPTRSTHGRARRRALQRRHPGTSARSSTTRTPRVGGTRTSSRHLQRGLADGRITSITIEDLISGTRRVLTPDGPIVGGGS